MRTGTDVIRNRAVVDRGETDGLKIDTRWRGRLGTVDSGWRSMTV